MSTLLFAVQFGTTPGANDSSAGRKNGAALLSFRVCRRRCFRLAVAFLSLLAPTVAQKTDTATAVATGGQSPEPADAKNKPRSMLVKDARDFPGADLGARINAAFASANGSPVEVVAGGVSTIATQIVVPEHGHLFLGEGTYTPAPKVATQLSLHNAAPFVLKSNSSLTCQSWNTILVEPTQVNYWTVVGTESYLNTAGSAGADTNIHIEGCHFLGAHASADGGVRATVGLGNCINCSARHLWLEKTNTNGIVTGGSAIGGNHAKNVVVSDILTTGVVAQNIAVVNAEDVRISDITLRDCGGMHGAFCSFIDIEPNTPKDTILNVRIDNFLIDNRAGTYRSANAVIVQNGAQASWGPVSVTNGNILGPGIGNGVITSANTIGVEIANLNIRRTQQAGLSIYGEHYLVNGNNLICVGGGGIPGMSVYATDSNFFHNSLADDSAGCGGSHSTNIAEAGEADRNFYDGNVNSGIVLVGPHSRVQTNIDPAGNYAIQSPTYFARPILGGVRFSSLGPPETDIGLNGCSSNGGELGAGTFYYRVTAKNSVGESTGSKEILIACTSGATNQASINWRPLVGALQYCVYGRTRDAEQQIACINAPATHYSDTGKINPHGELPTVDMTGQVTAEPLQIGGCHLGGDLAPDQWNRKAITSFSSKLDFASVAAQQCLERTIKIIGGVPGDAIAIAWPKLDHGLIGLMYVSSPGTITVRLCNLTAKPIQSGSHTFGGFVMREAQP